MKHLRLTTLCATILLLASSAFALNPINYQGRITDAGGSPVPDGVYTCDFVLWDTETLGSVIWSDFGNAITTTNGLFSFDLGLGSPFPDNLFHDDSEIWLTVIVNGEPQEPRVRIGTAAYANEVTAGPGVAHLFNSSSLIGPLSAWGSSNSNDVMILGLEINCPTDGYVVATATGYFTHEHTNGSDTWGRLTLGTVNVGGPIDFNNIAWTQMDANAATGTYRSNFAITKVEAVSAGSRTYYLRGAAAFSNDIWLGRPHLTLMFFPAAYGTITSSVSPINPQGPDGVEEIPEVTQDQK